MRRLRCREDVREVDVRTSGASLQVVVGGEVFTPRVEAIAPGTFTWWNGDHAERFHCVRDGTDIHLFWRGVVYHAVEEREGRRPTGRHAAGGLEAPMPGKVIKLSVSAGDRIAKGQEVLVVEAMKMENALRAPRDGVVKTVGVHVGDMVAPGVVLVELE